MSTAVPRAGYAASPPSAAAPPAKGWLLGPWLDALFVANLAWPLAAWFTVLFTGTTAGKSFGFMLAYFIIMPHRWITIPLVFCDRQRLQQRGPAFLGVLAFVILLCSSIKLTMSSLALLVAIDYAWNAWHFAAQHSGIGRIYARVSRPEEQTSGMFEKVLLRSFYLYVLLRLTGMFAPEGSAPWLDWARPLTGWLTWCDYLMVAAPLTLLGRELLRFRPSAWGRMIYLSSVYSLYACLLIAIRMEHEGLIIGCGAAATMFHSTEYLAVVSWHVPKNRGLSQSRLFAKMIPHWTLALVAFMGFFACSNYFLHNLETWIWINLNVSLLHYAYDGMIWKRPKKKK